jgi:DNA-directed RNA polymerase subunit omega
MKAVNADSEERQANVINSRYSIVMATAKRAREIVDGALPLVKTKDGEKALSIAIEELGTGKIHVFQEEGDE